MAHKALRELFVKYLFCFVGLWYKWGGDDPSGFDCSGVAVEGLKGVGILSRGKKVDYTAQGLYGKFRYYKVSKPYIGCLAFWFSKDGKRIVHVEPCISSTHTIGASGGGSGTLTEEKAKKHNAFIKLRPIRKDAVFVDPFKAFE